MLTNNQVKHIASLKLKKFRDEYGEFIAEGNTLVADLAGSPYNIKGVYALSQWITGNLDLIRSRRLPVFEADPKDMERISSLSTPGPVLAVVEIPPVPGQDSESSLAGTLQSAVHHEGELVLVLDGISDPGNLGTMLRIADWFGISRMICSKNTVELYNPKVVQASMGSIARVKVSYAELVPLLENLKGRVPVYGTFLQGDNIYQSDVSGKGLIVIGSEAHGISGEVSEFITERIYIPPFGKQPGGRAESLNAAVAAAIVVSEFRRRSQGC